jgi:hypothetical protein
VAAQRADTHAQTVNLNGVRGCEDFRYLGLALPLFAGLAVIQLFVDPRDQTTGQRYAKVIYRQLATAGELVTLRSISRIADAGLASSVATLWCN